MSKSAKLAIFILLLCLGSGAVSAQEVYTSSGRSLKQVKAKKKEEARKFDPQRIIIGGGMGFSFGQVTAVAVSPIVGYRFTDRLSAGVGLSYQYVQQKDAWAIQNPNSNNPNDLLYYDYKSNMISPSVWARFIVWHNLFLSAAFEQNFMSFNQPYTVYDYSANDYKVVDQKTWMSVPSLLVGGGFRQPVGERSSFVISIMYDVLQKDYSPYKGILDYRVGFNVGF